MTLNFLPVKNQYQLSLHTGDPVSAEEGLTSKHVGQRVQDRQMPGIYGLNPTVRDPQVECADRQNVREACQGECRAPERSVSDSHNN